MIRPKCYSCMRPESFCLCQYIDSIDTNTHFVILMHPLEYKKEKNGTGRLAHLQLKNSKIIMGIDFTNDSSVNKILNDKDNECFILYPSLDSINLSQDMGSLQKLTSHNKRRVLLIIDGTWPCAKKMLKLSLNLHDIPSISFDHKEISQFTIKQQPLPECLSTLESIKILLELMNSHKLEECNTENFLLPFKKMVELQLKCIESPPPGSYRILKEGSQPKLKDKYKTKSKRSLLFKK